MISGLLKKFGVGPHGKPVAADASATGATGDNSPPVYFFGAGAFLLDSFGPRILDASGGRVTGLVSDRLAPLYPKYPIGPRHRLPVITLQALRELAARGPVEVVHFCEDLDQYWALEALRTCGPALRVVDFLARLYDLNLPHTYLPMLDEQAWWETHLADAEKISGRFGDELSRHTLAARVGAIMSADRMPLMRTAMPAALEYFNPHSPHASFVPRKDEIYVDIGAADGDTVERFRQASGDRFESILAFEPAAAPYRALAAKCEGDARIRVFAQAVGDTTGPVAFHENPSNPLGGNMFVGNSAPVNVDCVRLDDAVEHCSLIKMDVEGFECSVVRGAARLIHDSRPDMAITCYHYPQDMGGILDEVLALHRYRYVALRHYSPCLYDSVLLFSDRQSFGD